MSTGAVGNDVFRTTPELVKGLLRKVHEGFDITPFIQTANELVTELCTSPIPVTTTNSVTGQTCTHIPGLPNGLVPPNPPYSPAKLELIERWLSAHCYTVYDRTASAKTVGKASAKYDGVTDMILSASQYGQMAMMLDTNGNLARWSRHAKQGVRGLVVNLGREEGYWERPNNGWGWGLFGLNDL